MVLPETSGGEGAAVAERIRQSVAASHVPVATTSDPIMATVSLGLAVLPEDGVEAREIVQSAELALYRAKLAGRDCVRASTAGDELQAEPRAAVVAGSRAARPAGRRAANA